jgi:hypothetical protein
MPPTDALALRPALQGDEAENETLREDREQTPPSLPSIPSPLEPLPTRLDFDPESGFAALYTYLNTINPISQTKPIRIARAIATYKDKRHRDGHIASAPEEWKEQTAMGVTISSANRHWPATGRVVGLVCSPVSNAARASQGENCWHVVGLAREGATVWLYDTEHHPDFYTSKKTKGQADKPPRFPRNMANVRALAVGWSGVKGVWVKSPHPDYVSTLECMGRSMAWVEGLATGQIVWPSHDLDEWTWHSLG